MLNKKTAQKIYEDYYGFEPNQEDLELWLYGQAAELDHRMLTTTGEKLDRLQLAKNEIAGLLDELAFNGGWQVTLGKIDDNADYEAYRDMLTQAT